MVNYNDQRKYWSEFVFYERLLVIKKVAQNLFLGGRPVSNRRPLEPQSSALTS